MPYRLIITRPDGFTFQSHNEPLDTRTLAGIAAFQHLPAAAPDGSPVTIGQAKALGRMVRDAALGETVAHPETGYRFRTEEF